MLKGFDPARNSGLEGWYLDLPPAGITVYSMKTGRQVQEPSLVAVTCKREELSRLDLRTGEPWPAACVTLDKLAAVGRAALDYRNRPGIVVFSPFRQGQIAHYHGAQQLIRVLLGQAGLKLPVPKPAVCIHVQEHTTQVEEQALAEAAIQSGARRVFFYSEPLPVMLDGARRLKELQSAFIVHIDPQAQGLF